MRWAPRSNSSSTQAAPTGSSLRPRRSSTVSRTSSRASAKARSSRSSTGRVSSTPRRISHASSNSRSKRGRGRTDGRFDPTVHDAVLSAGYDRSFELVARAAGRPALAAACGGAVRLTGSRIELDAGVRLDLGGIGKGYAVDRAAELLAQAGPCLVNAGGDVAVLGGSWPIGVDGAVTLELSSGAAATSGRDRRHWCRAGRELHHLIDPSTGSPAETDLLRATAVGVDAVEAEVLATWLFLLGEDEALASGITCVLVGAGGSVRLGGDLA